MIDPASGPFLFDTSADSYLEKRSTPAERAWVQAYLAVFLLHVPVITVIERLRGYGLLIEKVEPSRRAVLEMARREYLRAVETEVLRVAPLNTAGAVIAAELMVLVPVPPSPPRRSHRLLESRLDRLNRWRFDILIAATALATSLPLIHNNPEDFENLRGVIERVPGRFPGVGPLNLILVKRLAA